MERSEFIKDYEEAILECGEINFPYDGDCENYLQTICNHLNIRLSKYQFGIKAVKGKIKAGTEMPESEITEYKISDKEDLILYINKVKTLPYIKVKENIFFDKLSKCLLKIVSGQTDKFDLYDMKSRYGERIKELYGIRQATILLDRYKDLHAALRQICDFLPNAFQYPEYTHARIKLNDKIFKTANFEVCGKGLVKKFQIADDTTGSIEIYYSKKFPDMPGGDGPFMPEEHYLIDNLSMLITGAIFGKDYQQIKESAESGISKLKTVNEITDIIKLGRDTETTLNAICAHLPQAVKHKHHSCARITFENKEYTSDNFDASHRNIKEQFITIDNNKGIIEIFYTQDYENYDEGLFSTEEKCLLKILSILTCSYLNELKGRDLIHKTAIVSASEKKYDTYRKSFVTQDKKTLQSYFIRQMMDKYMYFDMMRFKVQHVLFVATLYDAFVLENEDSFFERFMGNVYQFSLFTLPRITGVSSEEEAIEAMNGTNIDMVIIMPGMDKHAPIKTARVLKQIREVPVFILLNKKEDAKYFEAKAESETAINKVFIWNGDANIFFTIVKSYEDSINVENDTAIGLVRVILLIEDSPIYYSKYLQMLFSIVFGQIQKLLPDVEKNEIDKIVKMRSRPKILHARNHEEAIRIFNKYKDFLMCVVSDVEFECGGKIDKTAGLKFMRYMRSQVYTVPIIFQSTEELQNLDMDLYKENKVFFVNKNSDSLLDELKRYVMKYLGFGDFEFKNSQGDLLGTAHSLREFETMLAEMPEESIYRHAVKNQFSIWLMGRGEIELARRINAIKTNSLEDVKIVRPLFIEAINEYRADKKKGKILSFDETSNIDERNIVMLASGSLGGKGRGLAFIDTLIYNLETEKLLKNINVLSPATVIIGTDAFTEFIKHNKLYSKILDKNTGFEKLRELFFNGELSDTLKQRIKTIVYRNSNPLAVRSSSTSEDSINQPFAGVFDTYIIANEPDRKEQTVELVCQAVKLIYASVYSEKARNYYNVVQHKIEEEKMAVIIQVTIGSRFGDYFYPHISGVAQSYNFYPVACMKPEEGYAVAGVGLGCYVVGGRNAFRFSPKYPQIPMYNMKDMIKLTQTEFFALDCRKEKVDLLNDGETAALQLLDISEAEKHGALKHLASVYNPYNDSISPGLDTYGPRVVNFADILEYNYFPLAQTINIILNAVKDAFGSPVEIEYAVNLNKTVNGRPSFYLLQIKPLAGAYNVFDQDLNQYNKNDMLLYSDKSLGNGNITDVTDVIYIREDKFSKLETREMVKEIDYLNSKMLKENRKYVLIGPGRWGSSDRFLGVPVEWSQITNAAVIVETSLENYPLDFSHGSHFFHNITSMHVGYLAVQNYSTSAFIKHDILDKMKVREETPHFKHVRFEKPLNIVMDGKNNEACIIL